MWKKRLLKHIIVMALYIYIYISTFTVNMALACSYTVINPCHVDLFLVKRRLSMIVSLVNYRSKRCNTFLLLLFGADVISLMQRRLKYTIENADLNNKCSSLD